MRPRAATLLSCSLAAGLSPGLLRRAACWTGARAARQAGSLRGHASAASAASAAPSLYAGLLGPLLGSLNPAADAQAAAPVPWATETDPVAPECAVEPAADDSNRVLVENVRAPARANPAPQELYDLVVLGAGVAGLISCVVARQLGRRVALVERHYMGGDCLNTGCVPSKALIAAARQAAIVRDSAAYGVELPPGEVSVDFGAVMARLRRIRAEISEHDSVQRYTSELGVDVFIGQASFSGSHEVKLEAGPALRFRKCVIATGAGARLPLPLRGVPHLTSANLWNLTDLPPRLLVVGSGPIGLEIAQAMQRLGSQVTVLAPSEHVLGKEEPEAANVVKATLERSGVTFLLGTRLLRVERGHGGLCTQPFGTYSVTVATASSSQVCLHAEALLNATGRVPNTSSLGFDSAGVTANADGSVSVDAQLRTQNPDVYAAGDCLPGPDRFTHAAEWQARMAVRNALLGEGLDAGRLLVPRATYTDPEVAAVGRTAAELRAARVPFDTFTRQLRDVDRSRCDGVQDGFAALHVAPGGRILGATVVGPHAGDHISEVTLCMQHGLTAADLAGTMHPYPTGAEVVRQAAQAYVRTRIFRSDNQALLDALSQPSPHIRKHLTAGGLAVVELDRPDALHACDVAMARDIGNAACGPETYAVLLTSTSPRAFCAGGDVKAMAVALRKDAGSLLPRLQLAHEYRSIVAVHGQAQQLPVVALMDGISMGFGLCLAGAATWRVVTERSLLAMPECAIGIAPDVGFAALAAELPPGVGLCMALTGWQLRGADALVAGLATHFVSSETLPELRAVLCGMDWKAPGDVAVRALGAALDAAARVPEPQLEQSLLALLPAVADVFAAAPSVADVRVRLETLAWDDGTDPRVQRWAAERLKGLARGCPLTQAASLRLLHEGERDLARLAGSPGRHERLLRSLRRDYGATLRLLRRPDFLEGVRATLVDKDDHPSWACSLEAITEQAVEELFLPLPPGECLELEG